MSAERPSLGRFARHSLIYALGNGLNRVGAFLLLPIYTNYLSVAEYGVLELFYAVAAVVSGVLSVGISHATLRFYFEYEDEDSRRALVSTSLIAAFVIAAAGAGVVAIGSAELAHRLFPDADYSRALLLILAMLVFDLSAEVCQAYVRAREKSLFFVAIAGARLVVQVVANSFLVIVLHAGVEGVLLGNLGAVAVGWTILVAYTVRHCGLRFHLRKLVPVLRYSFPFLLTTMVGIVAANVDRFLINGLLTVQALGIYALATKFAKLLAELIGEPFSRAYGAFRFSIMNSPEAAPMQARLVRYLLAGATIAGLGVLYFTRDLLMVMSDREFWPAAQILPLLVLAAILDLVSYPLQSGILFKKRTDQIFYIGTAIAVVRIAAGFALIGAFGLTGACAAVLLGSAVNVVLTDRLAQRFFPVKYEHGRLAYILLCAAAFYCASLPLASLAWPVALAGKCVLLAGYVAVLLISPIFDRHETVGLWGMLRRKALPGSPASE